MKRIIFLCCMLSTLAPRDTFHGENSHLYQVTEGLERIITNVLSAEISEGKVYLSKKMGFDFMRGYTGYTGNEFVSALYKEHSLLFSLNRVSEDKVLLRITKDIGAKDRYIIETRELDERMDLVIAQIAEATKMKEALLGAL